MRAVLLFFMVINFAFCFEVPVDCTQIFEARKEEISKELEVIDEQRQALEKRTTKSSPKKRLI